MTWLKTETSTLTLEDLKKGVAGTYTKQEKSALDFCHAWLNGKTEFEFRTSGSTGEPKKIVFSRKQLEASARMTGHALELRPGYTALVCLDTQFIAGAMMLVRSLVIGMNMRIRTPEANPLKAITDVIDFAAFVPYHLVAMLPEEAATLNRMKVIIIGGAPMESSTNDEVKKLTPSVFATYGMTETATHVALQRLNGVDRQEYFQLLPGVTATVDDRGCLVLNAQHLGIASLVTNDCVSLLDATRFYWKGRIDRVINSGGIKIHPESLERTIQQILNELKMGNRFFITGVPDHKLGERVVLVLEGALRPHEEQRIMTQLQARLEKYNAPREIYFAIQFDETSTQKIDMMATMQRHFLRSRPQ